MGTYEFIRWAEIPSLQLEISLVNAKCFLLLWEPGGSSARDWRGAVRHIGTHTDVQLSAYICITAQVLAAQLRSRPSGNKTGVFLTTSLYHLASSLQGAKTVSLIISELNQTVSASALD